MSGESGARRLGDSIVALGRVINSRRLDDRRAAHSGVPLTMVTSNVLRHVVEQGPLRPGLLAERARMQPTALSRQLGILERDGAITRVPDPADGRGSLVKATPRGRAHDRKVRDADRELIAAQLSGWSTADVDTLTGLLERLVVDLRASDSTRAPSGATTPPAPTDRTTARATGRRTTATEAPGAAGRPRRTRPTPSATRRRSA